MLQPTVAAYSPFAHQRIHHHPHHRSAHQQQQQQHLPLLHHHQPPQQHALHQDAYAPQPVYHAPQLLAPTYRPLQIPLQQQAESTQQLALAHQQATTPAFAPQAHQGHQTAPTPDSGLHLHHHNLNHAHVQHPQPYAHHRRAVRPPPPPPNMAYADEDMAEMQRLSDNFETEHTGPLVGQRQPSSAITQEYAHADATYQTKTAALPQKYSHYRKLRGDGKCGWRAVAFGYFERLLYINDSGKCFEEEARLRSLSNVLNSAGYDPYLYEDFADELYTLVRNIANAILEGNNGDEVLMTAFNDDAVQNYIITHFKTLTAAWMKTHQENYAGYMIGQTVDQYCDAHIMPMDSEIEHLGLSALKDVMLSPASFALEVMYLDRSVGDEVNLHRFDPISGYTAATVRLLYRPGHYDMLYKYEDVPMPSPSPMPPPAQESVAAYLQQNAPHPDYVPIGDYSDATDNLMFIPGMSIAPTHGWMSGPSYGSDFFSTPFASVQTCAPALPAAVAPVAPTPQPQMLQQAPSQPAYTPDTQASHVLPPTQMPTELVIRSTPHAEHAEHATASRSMALQRQMGGPFRASSYQPHDGFPLHSLSNPPLETPMFKNSHFNTAHFQNPEFQPEEWKPDGDYVTTTNTKVASRGHRPSG